jgi:ABC-type transporter MlaC component
MKDNGRGLLMRRMARHGLLAGGFAATVLLAPLSVLQAQNLVSPLSTTPPTTAAPAVPAAQTADKKPAPAHPAAKVAAHPAKPPVKKLATAPKKPEAKKIVAAKKPEPKKIAAAPRKPEEPRTAAAPPQNQPPSYTITSTHDHVVTQTTRIVPISSGPTPVEQLASAPKQPQPVTQIAALPKPPASPVEHPAPLAPPPQAAVAPPPHTMSPPAGPAAPAPPHEEASAPAAGFVSAFLGQAFHIARDTSLTSLQRRAELADLFAAKMDVSRIAGYTTRDELGTEPGEFQRRFRSILISYLVETYYPRIELAADPSITVANLPAASLPDGTAVVWTTFAKAGYGEQSIKWHLAPEGDGYKIVDILSAGASLVQMERDTFQSVMRDGGLPELMAKLDARTKALASAATE